jgi:hypothetical protein
MQLDQVMKRLRYFLDAGPKFGRPIAIEITGPSGIGKSEATVQELHAMAKRDGFDYGIGRHFTASWTPSDVPGYLIPVQRMMPQADGTMKEVTVAEWSMPNWTLDDNGVPLNTFKRGALICEEHDKAAPEVKKAFAPVTLLGGIGVHRLHAGIGVIMLTNDASSSRQGSTKRFDFEINRICILTASASVAGWMNWADQNDVHPMFKSFADDKAEVVFSGTVPEKQGPFCTPRSLVLLGRVASFMMDDDDVIFDKEGFVEIAQGMIGAPATQALMTHIELHDKVPKWREIVADPKRCKVPDNVAGQLMVAHQCAYNVDDKTVEQAVTYVRRLNPEFHMTFVKSATKRNFRLVNSKAIKTWTNEEPQLVALITALGGHGR